MPKLSKFDDFLEREVEIESRLDSAGGSELFHKMEVNELSRQSVGLEYEKANHQLLSIDKR